jgi:hypothetical protein
MSSRSPNYNIDDRLIKKTADSLEKYLPILARYTQGEYKALEALNNGSPRAIQNALSTFTSFAVGSPAAGSGFPGPPPALDAPASTVATLPAPGTMADFGLLVRSTRDALRSISRNTRVGDSTMGARTPRPRS